MVIKVVIIFLIISSPFDIKKTVYTLFSLLLPNDTMKFKNFKKKCSPRNILFLTGVKAAFYDKNSICTNKSGCDKKRQMEKQHATAEYRYTDRLFSRGY